MRAIVLESHPLMRMGLQSLLRQLPELDVVIGLEPYDFDVVDGGGYETALLVYSMADDASDNAHLLRCWRARMPGARVLVLCDNMWMCQAEADFPWGGHLSLPKTASLPTLEAAVRRLLELDAEQPAALACRNPWMPPARVASHR
ncbi:hypothetical protein BKK79_05225 [Cupriavidus sp. USMAA2-4]|uniref:Response regulator transcription factor n=1 Tax=Cupriavidus malaysiensis TaxID=367825 RepID=A0ABN4TFU5_9BURK|nr:MULTISPECIES: response regulator transcription factor [Cupriavidus]AOY91291.1 hypothetical protein BKK79_05225 [Cupriavidus sp. USMAA2-4]AOY99140.1 hypothetical protein BKK81_07625 [Cupriavidus sp. USMAHM13]AOZ05561.1 hypothetical protein BKK80_06925 [Cupriavidus malaysiensis]